MIRPESSEPLVIAKDLAKVYQRGREKICALGGVSFEIKPKEFIAITGPSGAGKTTLLNLVGCMDIPTSGILKVGGREVQQLSDEQRTVFRREQIGFVFQHFGLLPTLTVAENLALPLVFSRRSPKRTVAELLETVGLTHRANHRPFELSGGEMQRVAIARAMINNPAILLADEPPGTLDRARGATVIHLFKQLQCAGLTIIVVTHNDALASCAERQLVLEDGHLRGRTAASPVRSGASPDM